MEKRLGSSSYHHYTDQGHLSRLPMDGDVHCPTSMGEGALFLLCAFQSRMSTSFLKEHMRKVNGIESILVRRRIGDRRIVE